MAECWFCGKRLPNNGNEIQFCDNGCVYQYWARLYEKYGSKKSSRETKRMTGADLTKERADMSYGDFAQVLHTRSLTLKTEERKEYVTARIVRKVNQFLGKEVYSV